MRKKAKLLALTVLVLGISWSLAGFRSQKLLQNSILLMEIAGEVPETVPYNPLWGFFEPPPITLLDKVMLLRKARVDKKVKAVVVAIRDNSLGFGKAEELRQAILSYRKSGKPAVCYLELEGDADLSYYLAGACDRIYLAPASFMNLNGLDSTYYFLGGFFNKLKVKVQVAKVREYKTFGDMLAGREMSPWHREMAESILNDLFSQYLSGVAQARNKSQEQIQELVNQYLVLPEKYLGAGLIDGVKYLDEILKELDPKEELKLVKEREYLSYPAKYLGINTGPKVAVVFGVGSIVNREPGNQPFTASIMSAERMVKELERLAEDDSVKAVIFRIDSGGGSALASDLIWRATQKLRQKKPLVVSMSDVAGSGGYYIACGADKIVAQPGTLTGSIGVVTAHFGLEELLGWLNLGVENLKRGEYADFDRLNHSWSPAEQEKAQQTVEGLYQLFLERVHQGRGLDKEEIDRIARGRVWTGRQAKELGLVDELGGFDKAVQLVKEMLGVKEVKLVYKKKPISFWKLLFGRAQDEFMKMTFGKFSRDLKKIRQAGLFSEGENLFLSPEIEVR